VTADDVAEGVIAARVVVGGTKVSLLVEEPILGDRRASHFRAEVDGRPCQGLAVFLDADAVLLVLGQTLAEPFEAGSAVNVSQLRLTSSGLTFSRARERLKSLLSESDSLGAMSDRAARHALLYILEARDAEVKQQRIALFKAALSKQEE
jgi:hypothetical protein